MKKVGADNVTAATTIGTAGSSSLALRASRKSLTTIGHPDYHASSNLGWHRYGEKSDNRKDLSLRSR